MLLPCSCRCFVCDSSCFWRHRGLNLAKYLHCVRPGAGGEANREAFEAAMKTVDVTFQNLDSSEISLTDVSHYFDSDPTKLVAGLRGDGRTPSAFIADTTTANAQVG